MQKLKKEFYLSDPNKDTEFVDDYLKKNGLSKSPFVGIIKIDEKNTNLLSEREKRMYNYYQWYLERYQFRLVVIQPTKDTSYQKHILIYSDMKTDFTKKDNFLSVIKYRLFQFCTYIIFKHPILSFSVWIIFLIVLAKFRYFN